MKQIILTLAVVLLPILSKADERPIKFEQLPTKAQEFVNKHFCSFKLSYAKYDNEIINRSYDVIFTNGTKIEFGRRGEWTKIECRSGQRVPTEVLPTSIGQFIKAHHEECGIVEVERDINSLEIKLSNGLDLIFGEDGTFKRYD